jgi:hypothetical protein
MTLGEESIAFVRFACVAAAFCLPRSEHLAGSLNTQAEISGAEAGAGVAKAAADGKSSPSK